MKVSVHIFNRWSGEFFSRKSRIACCVLFMFIMCCLAASGPVFKHSLMSRTDAHFPSVDTRLSKTFHSKDKEESGTFRNY